MIIDTGRSAMEHETILENLVNSFLKIQMERKHKEDDLNRLKRLKMDKIMEECRAEKDKLDSEFGKKSQ